MGGVPYFTAIPERFGRRAAVVAVAALALAAGLCAAPAQAHVQAGCSPARPDDPPIGVTLQTLSGDPAAAIRINGAGVRDTYDRNGIFVAVLEACNRQVEESGTVPRNPLGLDQLARIANHWIAPDSLMIISGTHGVARADKPYLDAVARAVGATAFTSAEIDRLAAGSPFSIIGNPGGPEGTAWTKVAPQPNPGNGDITGWLQFNHGSGRYDFVTGQDITFMTSVPGGPADGNTIRVNGTDYGGKLPLGAASGFEILSLDSQTLARRDLFFESTQTAAGAQAMERDLATAARPAAAGNPPPLVFIQSIGKPLPGPDGWQAAANTIAALGGTPLAFLNLDGKSDYTLVGSTQAGQAATEAGRDLGEPGPVSGVLSPARNLGFLPLVAGPAGGVNLQQVNLEYQAPTQFPPVNSAAENWIGQKVRLCGASSTSCNFRQRFGSDYQAAWLQIANDFNSDSVKTYPGDGHGFDVEEYRATRIELAAEISMFNQVKNYFTVLQDSFGKSGQDKRVDVKDLGEAVYKAVLPPPKNEKTIFIIGLIGKALSLGSFAGPPISAVTSGLAAAFALAAYLAGRPNDESLADAVKVKSDELAARGQAVITDAVDSFTTEARVIVTDYGKLRDAARYIADGDWKLPPDPKDYVPTLRQAVRTWFAESLVPFAYPWMVRGTPVPLGPTTANRLTCGVYAGNWPFPDKKVGDAHPFFAEPPNAQMRVIQGWGSDRQPFLPTFFFSRANPVMRIFDTEEVARNTIPQSLANTLFGKSRDDLGINLMDFISPRYFGGLHNANNESRTCGL